MVVNFALLSCSFAEQRVKILETAKLLVDDTKRLVNSAGASQEALAEAATKAGKTIESQAQYVKSAVGALTGKDDMESQVCMCLLARENFTEASPASVHSLSLQLVLLTSVKDVANALKNLIDATRNASGKSVQDPTMEALKTSAKVSLADLSCSSPSSQ